MLRRIEQEIAEVTDEMLRAVPVGWKPARPATRTLRRTTHEQELCFLGDFLFKLG